MLLQRNIKKPFRGLAITLAALVLGGIISLHLFIDCPFHMPGDLPTPPAGQYIHISIDDCIDVFQDLSLHSDRYRSAFDQPVLHFLMGLHERYGVTVSLYFFYSWDVEAEGRFQLHDMTSRYAEEFSRESDWLKFGFHAKDADAYETLDAEMETLYYESTVQELLRITGSKDSIDHFVRLDRYWADRDVTTALLELDDGIDGLLAADDPSVQSYGLTEQEMEQLYTDDWYIDDYGVAYTPTDIWLEGIENDDEFYRLLSEVATQPRIIVFTHEWLLTSRYPTKAKLKVQRYMKWIAEYGCERNVIFGFPQDDAVLQGGGYTD